MVIKFEKTECSIKQYSSIHQKYKRNNLDIVLFISNDTELYLAISDSATYKDKVDIFVIEELSYQIINDTLVIDDKNLVRILDFAKAVSDETYLYKDIPHRFFEGDVQTDRMTPEEVHQLADKILRQGFAKIKQKYNIV